MKLLPGLLMLTLALAACGGGAEAPAEQTTDEIDAVVLGEADVAVARRESLGAGVLVTGTLAPYRQVEVRAQVPGVLADLRVDRGEAVREGQTLARIQAEGIRGMAASARAAVAAAEANLALARRQLESAKTLFDAGAMSEIEYRQAQAGFEAAQAQLSAARAQADGAGEQASRATVTAPVSGEISERYASEGEAVNPGQAIFTIVNSSILELAGQVPVSQAVGLRTGMPVEFTIEAYPGRVLEGEVARIEPTADPDTRQVGIYVRLPNEERNLVGGLFASGRILTGSQEESVVAPIAAVRGEAADAHVWIVRDGRATRQPVTVGVRDTGRGVVQILAGLEGGERVIVAPGEVTEGMPVRLSAGGVVSTEER